MSDEIQTGKAIELFNFDGANVRVIVIDGDPWFVATDVAKLLGYANPQKAVRTHCRGVTVSVTPSSSGVQTMNIIPERDVYRLVMRSRLPAAERFEDWVVGEVLPSIRKTGAYRHESPAAPTHILLAESPSEWRELWGKDLHDALCDIYGQPKGGRPKRFVGGLQAKLYKLIAGEDCYAEMKRRTPSPRHGDNLHQHFSNKARTGFEEQLAVVFGVLRTSHNPADFWERMEHLYTGRPMQLRMGGAA